VDGVGNIYAVWEDDTATNSNILFSRSTDGGATFSAPLNVSGSSASSSNPLISVDRLGAINVVWVSDAPGNNDVFFSRSTDGGATFSAPLNLSNDPADSLSPQLAVDGSGNINVVWESDNIKFGVLFSHSTDGGATFSAPVDLATNTGGSFGAQLVLAADGSINVVWEDDSNSGSNISYSRSSDNGATFSAPKNLSSTLGNSFESQIAVDAAGNIDVLWADSTPGYFL
jgi:Neuraminidase (sialidase)